MREWLKKIRDDKGLTQEDVATQAGIARTYYTRIENGKRGNKLPPETAMRIADVLEFDWTIFYNKKAS